MVQLKDRGSRYDMLPVLWLDDDVSALDREWLGEHASEDRLIEVSAATAIQLLPCCPRDKLGGAVLDLDQLRGCAVTRCANLD